MVVCSCAVWQYREEGIAEGSRRIFIESSGDGDRIVVVGNVRGGIWLRIVLLVGPS